jgi:hypothetical protein
VFFQGVAVGHAGQIVGGGAHWAIERGAVLEWPKGGRSKFSVDESLEIRVNSPKIGPDPGKFNRLLGARIAHSYSKLGKETDRAPFQP